ncbi:tripartite tricarboxylate transporter substrate binding protein [Comamonas sp. Tr-654]|uniref:Bug family tripartite tricarboxylate transporter substrate binding protein n=1 Tax=Comamonas sp. Tr-654 TaxID=2608341 RepID=UPI001420B0AC|nr:tripartite tricarboxylate transporter substrate binding protein [Comamonas sp. Tr-654]NIF85132.1 tripartite tricarboxylate transporter substrate binding protein [Comamonas sp. Tr-654]
MKRALFLACTLVAGAGAWAEADYPAKPVTLVVAYAPGGMTDILTRRVAKDLQVAMGQPFIVENRAGATGQIATEYVSRRAADGYTILVGATSHVINPALKKSLPYDARKAFDPIALFAVSPNLVLVNSKLGIKSFDQLKQAAAERKTLPFGTAGAGGSPHIVGEVLARKSGLPLVHVAYKGAGPAMADLVSGQVPFGISESVTADAYLKDERIAALAVASAQRSRQYPQVPTLSELGYKGIDLSTWVGVYAPAGTPRPILQKLNEQIRKAIANPDTAAYIQSTGSEPGDLDLKGYASFVNSEFDKWARVIKEANVKDD